eukprot:sb/3475512/
MLSLIVLLLRVATAPTALYSRSLTRGLHDGFGGIKSLACNDFQSGSLALARNNITELPRGSFRCPFTPSVFKTCPGMAEQCLNSTWNCLLPQNLVCDGSKLHFFPARVDAEGIAGFENDILVYYTN